LSEEAICQKRGEIKKVNSLSDTPPQKKKKTAFHLWRRDFVFITVTPIIQNANQWERGRERCNCTVARSLSLVMWQHGSCTLTNSAAWKIPVVDYILPLNLECAKNLCELRLGSSLVWFPNLKTARQGTIYTISLGKRQGLTIQTELWSSFTCWKMRCQWTYAVVFIHSN